MDAEHVERVVIAKRALHRGDEEEAHGTGNEAEDQCAHRAGVTGSGCYRNEACDNARGKAQKARLALEQPLDEQPRDTGRGGGNEGVRHRHHGTDVGLQVRAGIEAEPADPQQRGADHGERQRMGRHGFFAEADAAAEQQRADKARDTGVDVNDRAAGEVKCTELEAVARPCERGVVCPSRDRSDQD